MKYRIEKDTMGEVQVPADALWGAQTQRALENFQISGIKFAFPFGRIFSDKIVFEVWRGIAVLSFGFSICADKLLVNHMNALSFLVVVIM